ncbi:MAG: hypothetical protein WC841_04070 [Candidatus Shapirobacteria bacterium]|jgi:hypothetical protein
MFTKIKNKITYAVIAAPLYAADDGKITVGPQEGSQWGDLQALTVGRIVSGAISLVMLVVALVFFFILIMGGLKWVTSEGDEKKVAAARAQITNGLIGLAIVFAAFAIMRLINVIFGVDILNLEIKAW